MLRAKSEPVPALVTVQLESGRIEAPVRVSDRARRARVRILESGPEFVLPCRATASDLRRLVRETEDWVRFQLAKQAARQAGSNPNCVLVEGRQLHLSMRCSGTNWVEVSGDELLVTGPDPSATLETWIKALAGRRIAERVAVRSGEMAVQPVRVSLRDQKTKWGACSSRGTLTFNYRLVMAPPEVLDYVVVHELAHLTELNHSARFWAIVERHCPSHRAHRRWLRTNGHSLRVPCAQQVRQVESL